MREQEFLQYEVKIQRTYDQYVRIHSRDMNATRIYQKYLEMKRLCEIGAIDAKP
jgi:hypothetical protein